MLLTVALDRLRTMGLSDVVIDCTSLLGFYGRLGFHAVDHLSPRVCCHGEPAMTAASTYLQRSIEVLETLAASQADPIERSAQQIATAIADGHRVFVAATSHVLHTELYLRAGVSRPCIPSARRRT